MAELAKHGAIDQHSHDGWGVAYYEGPDVRLVKEAGPADISDWVPILTSLKLKSRVVIAHIRRMSRGAREYRNTQPFVRELGGRKLTFAHNGDLGDTFARALPVGSFRPVGTTDSELAFCSLLGLLEPLWRGVDRTPTLGERVAVIEEFAKSIRPLGPANFIYSDGDVIFAHGDVRRQADGVFRPPGLHRLTRHCIEPNAFDTPAVSVTGRSQAVTLLASVPLSDEPWLPAEAGQVLVVKNGELVEQVVDGSMAFQESLGPCDRLE